MDEKRFSDSQFWAWYYEQSKKDIEHETELREVALEFIVESVKSGALTCLDGVESPMTRKIQAYHAVSEFETNDNWLGSDQEWKCPGCSRDKFQISRIGKQGQILAKLVVHHDHMEDLLEETFHSTFASLGADEAQVTGKRLIERIAQAFAAHDRVLVCEDCNTADIEAKKVVGAPKYFSFTLSQIKQFVAPEEHRSHRINPEVVQVIWEKAKPIFELRSRLISQVAQAAVTGSHWYEPFAWNHDPIPTIAEARFDVQLNAVRRWAYPNMLLSRLGHQTKKDNRDYSKWRITRRKQSAEIPTNYIAILLSSSGCANSWNSTPDDWICPICKRKKVEIPYVGDKSRIVFNITTSSRSGIWAKTHWYCGNCKTVLLGLKDEVQHLTGKRLTSSYEFVSPEELSEIIAPRANCAPHVVLKNEGRKLLDRCVSRLKECQ